MAKKSYDELVQLMRDNGFSDEEMPQALKVLMADKKIGPKLRNDYEMSQMRRKPQPEPPGAFSRGASGLGSVLGGAATAPFKSSTYENMLKNMLLQWGAGHVKDPATSKVYMDKLQEPLQRPGAGPGGVGAMVGAPDILAAHGKGDDAGAIGQGLGQAALLGLMFGKNPFGKVGSTTSEVEKFAAITDKATAPIQKLLSEQGEALKGAMNGQLSNVAALRGNVGIRNLIAKIQNLEAVPDTKVGSLKAAREGLEELQAKIGSGKPVSWNDLFELNKRLKQANTGIADKATKQALTKITDTVNGELTNGAKQAGLGDHYTNWQKDYAQYGDLRRRYEDALSSKTDAQREVNRTAKSTRRQVFGTSVGSPKVNKLAKVNSQILKQAHKAMDELHGQVKGRPLANPPVPPTNPSAAAKWLPGGGVPPKPGQLPGQGIQPKPAQLPAGQYEQPGPGVNTPQPLGLPPARTPMPAISQSTWEQLLQLLSGKPKQLPPAGSIQLGPSSLPSTTINGTNVLGQSQLPKVLDPTIMNAIKNITKTTPGGPLDDFGDLTPFTPKQ